MRPDSTVTRRGRDLRFGHLALTAAMLAILVLGVTRMGRAPRPAQAAGAAALPAPRHAPVTAPVYTSGDNVLGQMNGRALKIPRFYLLTDPDFADARAAAGGARALRSFAIRLRLSTFEPVRTTQDAADWNAGVAGEPSLYESFATVGIYAGANPSPSALQGILADIETDAGPAGAFHVQPEPVVGLAHATSDEGADFTTNEVFYDDKGWSVVIPCHSFRQPPATGTPPVSACQMEFPLPELRALAVVDLTKKDVARWKEIETAVVRIVGSFASGG